MKPKQIYYRIIYNFFRPSLAKRSAPQLRFLHKSITIPVKKKKSLINKDTFFLLNQKKSLSQVNWDDNKDIVSKLWRYNQHYFDDLNASMSSSRKEWHDFLLKNWLDKNSKHKGIGWDPYPTSLRIVNWIKWKISGNKVSKNFIQSLADQSRWLEKRLEFHILGNHLFSNAKALVYSGLFFSGKEAKKWLDKGLKIIDQELDEQILNDGGNFERSPMYHSIFLEDILDLINITQTYPNIVSNKNIKKWKKIANKMFVWLHTMVHPDGEISFFNDAAIGIAPTLKELVAYAKRLGVEVNFTKFNKVKHLSKTGYIRLTSKNVVALLDVAPVGPDYIPGHAHADTLSFELSLFGQRVLVNTGTSEYGDGEVRQYERSTKAHNTVMINKKNSSEVWSGFRVARRAYPYDLSIKELKNYVKVKCAHDGYRRLFGKPIHKRIWKFYNKSLIIQDNINGEFKNAYAYFHFHTSINIFKIKPGHWKIIMPKGQEVVIQVINGVAILEADKYSPEFGIKLKSKLLKIAFEKKQSCINISWKNKNE